jgi:glycosyltransferase involved in cell wall biosynthesis
MLHDLIPLEFTDFVPASSSYFHGQMVGSVASYAAGLITTTKSASKAICRELQKRGRSDIPVVVEPLPVSPAFVAGSDADTDLTEVPYFVIVSSIEPRKNHLLLLNVWRDLVRSEGPRAPKLVIAGTRWRGHEPVTDMLKRSQTLRNHVVEIGGLTTPSLHRLISNARGLLMPSFAEGFGLPIVEAQALGVPVIASNIPAHREAGGDTVTYLNPTDGPGWFEAIRSLARQEKGAMSALVKKSHTWPEYMRRIEPFVQTIGAMERADVKLTVPRSAAVTPC